MIRRATLVAVVAMVVVSVATAEQSPRAQVTAQVRNAQDRAPTAEVLRLDEAVREALAKNPAIAAAQHTVAAQRAKVPQAKALPDPTLGVGWMGNIQPFSVQGGDPSSYRSVSAMQMLPFPGKQQLRGQIAAKEADAAQWDVEAVRRRLTADVKAAYYDYWYYSKAIETAQRNRDLLSKLSQIAEARYRVGKGIQPDVLKSQVEVSMLLQKLTTLEQQRAMSQARLNALLARDPESPLPPAGEVQQVPVSYSVDELYKVARQNDPEYQRMQQMVERNQLMATLATKEVLPDLSVGYMYQQRPMMPDMHGLTFTVNIPVFYKSKQRQQVRQAQEETQSAERSRDNRQNELYFEVKQEYLAAKASEQLLKLYSQGVVPQSSLALESSMAAYQVGNVDFLTVLGNFSTVLNYETEYYRELANYQTAVARMEALTGVELSGPQRLKPLSSGAPDGTPEAVPFPSKTSLEPRNGEER